MTEQNNNWWEERIELLQIDGEFHKISELKVAKQQRDKELSEQQKRYEEILSRARGSTQAAIEQISKEEREKHEKECCGLRNEIRKGNDWLFDLNAEIGKLKQEQDNIKTKIKAIIDRERIFCGEDLWQRDSLNQKLPEIMDEICELVGWCQDEEE